MLPNLDSPFVSFRLTEEEEKIGSTFSPEQRAFIQNEVSVYAAAKLALTYDAQNPLSFAQQEAELQGKIGVLQYLLSLNPPVTIRSEN